MKTRLFLVFLAGFGLAQSALASASQDARAMVSRYGQVVDSKSVPGSSLTAWVVQKNGQRVMLYTTADGRNIFSGVVWDAKTATNLSDIMLKSMDMLPALPQAVREANTPIMPAISGKFKGAVPESIKTVAGLSGITQGRAALADTLYVMIDPRCGYSRLAYKNLKPYIAAGHTVKWIPIPALNPREPGSDLVAAMLQDPSGKTLDKQMSESTKLTAKPSKATYDAMGRSLAFFYAAFEHNGNQQPGVPIAFFIDQRTGKARMQGGVSDLAVINDIFGDK